MSRYFVCLLLIITGLDALFYLPLIALHVIPTATNTYLYWIIGLALYGAVSLVLWALLVTRD